MANPVDDGLPEDRVTCPTCRHFEPSSVWCRKYYARVLPNLPLRCMGFDPLPTAADKRNGPERWPTLKADIEEMRRLEHEHWAPRGRKPGR